jgi:hypothetical protein
MRALAATLLLAAAWTSAHAGDVGVQTGDVGVRAVVPIDPREHQRLHFFDRRDHHLVPGTVTIDAEPYVCDVDRKTFRKEDEFVAHLRTTHHTPVAEIPGRLVVLGGTVHFRLP